MTVARHAYFSSWGSSITYPKFRILSSAMKKNSIKSSRAGRTTPQIEEVFRRLNLPVFPSESAVGGWPQFRKFTLLKKTDLIIRPL